MDNRKFPHEKNLRGQERRRPLGDRRKVPHEGFTRISMVGWICRRERARRKDDFLKALNADEWASTNLFWYQTHPQYCRAACSPLGQCIHSGRLSAAGSAHDQDGVGGREFFPDIFDKALILSSFSGNPLFSVNKKYFLFRVKPRLHTVGEDIGLMHLLYLRCWG